MSKVIERNIAEILTLTVIAIAIAFVTYVN